MAIGCKSACVREVTLQGASPCLSSPSLPPLPPSSSSFLFLPLVDLFLMGHLEKKTCRKVHEPQEKFHKFLWDEYLCNYYPGQEKKMLSAPETSQLPFLTAGSSIHLVVTIILTFWKNIFLLYSKARHRFLYCVHRLLPAMLILAATYQCFPRTRCCLRC